MITRCANCGAELPVGAGRCPQCLALVKSPGFLQRLLERFNVNVTVDTGPQPVAQPGIHIKTTIHRTQSFKVPDPVTGEMKVYHSLEEVPEKYREQLRKALAGAAANPKQTTETGSDKVT